MKKKLSRKPLTRKSSPKKGSIAAFQADYQKLGFRKAQAEALAQLAYGQNAIRTRLDSLEAIALAQVLGAVEIKGELHMLSCDKRMNRDAPCNCDAHYGPEDMR